VLDEYLYISKRKVDSYSEQIGPGYLKHLRAEFGANLGVLSSKISAAIPELGPIGKMKLVEKFIDDNYNVGTTTDATSKWVRDKLFVRRVRLEANPEVFMLAGFNRREEPCMLFGSAMHAKSGAAEIVSYDASFFPDFAQIISEDVKWFDTRAADLEVFFNLKFTVGLRDEELAIIIQGLCKTAKGRTFQVEFLARHVFRGLCNASGTISNAFTPLYVKCLSESPI